MKKLLCVVAVVFCGTTVVGCSELADNVKKDIEWTNENHALKDGDKSGIDVIDNIGKETEKPEVTEAPEVEEKNTDNASLIDDVINFTEDNIGNISYSHEINYDRKNDILFITISNDSVECFIYSLDPNYNNYIKNQWRRKCVEPLLDASTIITNKCRENGLATHVSLTVVDGCSENRDTIMSFYDDSIEYSRY